MRTDPNFELVLRYVEANERRYSPKGADAGAAPWNDGSDTAALLGIWNLEAMISNGAWPSVYYNRLGWATPLAARGYRLLEMDECARRCDLAVDLVRRVEAANPGDDYTTDEWLSSTLMQAISDANWDRLDDRWFELTASTSDRMAEYLRAHGMAR